MGIISLLISILAFELSCFVFGYYVGVAMTEKLVDAYKELSTELETQLAISKDRVR